MKSDRKMTGRDFDALPAAERERIFQEIERGTPERRRTALRPPNAKEQKMFDRIARKMGRPKIGNGVKIVSVSVEMDLLKQADAFAKRAKLKRAELFTRALRGYLAST